MGCDIHMKVEAKFGNNWFQVLDLGLAEQNYDMFGLLARGVRTDYPEDGPYENIHIHEPNGIPDDISYSIWRDLHERVLVNSSDSGGGFVSYEVAVNLIKRCPWIKIYKEESPIFGKISEINELPPKDSIDNHTHIYIDDPDLHSHSNISYEEFKQIIDDYIKLCSDEKTKMHMSSPDNKAVYWKGVCRFCEAYKQEGYNIRLIYWFDS